MGNCVEREIEDKKNFKLPNPNAEVAENLAENTCVKNKYVIYKYIALIYCTVFYNKSMLEELVKNLKVKLHFNPI